MAFHFCVTQAPFYGNNNIKSTLNLWKEHYIASVHFTHVYKCDDMKELFFSRTKYAHDMSHVKQIFSPSLESKLCILQQPKKGKKNYRLETSKRTISSLFDCSDKKWLLKSLHSQFFYYFTHEKERNYCNLKLNICIIWEILISFELYNILNLRI